VVDPAAVPNDVLGEYTCDGSDTLYGISGGDLETMLNAFLGTKSATADYTDAETRMLASFQLARDALDAEPGRQGLGDFSGTQSERANFRDTLGGDVDAAISSLPSGVDTSLPSSDTFVLTMGAFFDSPPDQDSVMTDLGISSLIAVDDPNACYPSYEINEQALDWVVYEGAGMMVIPESVVDDVPCSSAAQCDGSETCEDGACTAAIPAPFDGDLYETVMDNDDWPYFMDKDWFDAFPF